MSDFSFTTDWYPYYLNGTSWDRFSVAIEKPYVYTAPTEIAVAYVTNNVAYLGKSSISAINVLAGIEQIGPAIDVSICYDARWYLGSNKEYIVYTTGVLFIAFVDTAHNLNVKMNITGAQLKLATGVDKCFIVRGWKHISDITIDQGIVVFYTKNGVLYSRSYVQQDAQTYTWEDEISYSNNKVITDLQVYRTADFRLAICVHYSDNTNQMFISNRVFPGQSIPVETVNIQAFTDNNIIITPVRSVNLNTLETVQMQMATDQSLIVFGNFDNSPASAYNNGGTILYLAIPTVVQSDNFLAFSNNVTVKDNDNNIYPILGVSYENSWLRLDMSDFNNAVGNITISYTSGVTGPFGTSLKPFSVTFTPKGLVPTPPDPPIPQSAINTNSEVIS